MLRTFGPTATTSDQMHRFVMLAAVAGISNPPFDCRSPSSSFRTSTRSAVMRIDCALVSGIGLKSAISSVCHAIRPRVGSATLSACR